MEIADALDTQSKHNGKEAFIRMRDAFEKAIVACDESLRTYSGSLAGQHVVLRIAGVGCAERITPPLRHLLDADAATPRLDLAIDVWDEQETGCPCPEPWAEPDGTNSEFGFIMGSADDQWVGCRRPGLLAWIDRSSRRIVACIRDSGELTPYELAKPFLFPLLLWHCDRGVEVIHAALVEKGSQGVLFAGREGAGKSTAAMACLQRGFNYLGDDYVGLRSTSDGKFVGHSLYNTIWLDRSHASQFPEIASHMIPGTSQKLPVVLSEVYPDRLALFASIRFLVLPRFVDGAVCRTLPASRSEAIFALAPTSVIKRPCAGQSGLDKIAALVESVPAFTLELGADVAGLTACIDDLLV